MSKKRAAAAEVDILSAKKQRLEDGWFTPLIYCNLHSMLTTQQQTNCGRLDRLARTPQHSPQKVRLLRKSRQLAPNKPSPSPIHPSPQHRVQKDRRNIYARMKVAAKRSTVPSACKCTFARTPTNVLFLVLKKDATKVSCVTSISRPTSRRSTMTSVHTCVPTRYMILGLEESKSVAKASIPPQDYADMLQCTKRRSRLVVKSAGKSSESRKPCNGTSSRST